MLGMLPYEFSEYAGIGGQLKQDCDDFLVEEIPAYEPIGDGTHLFLWIEKRDLTTQQVLRRITNVTGVGERDIGTAGLKDRTAVTRQYVSIPVDQADNIENIEDDTVRILHKTRHRNKLRTGHLRGNRFSILVRDVCSDALTIARSIQEEIERLGVPNYFGEQRFGIQGNTLETGLQLLRGELQSADLPRNKRRFLLRLSVSAVQSMLFNNALRERIEDRCLHTVLSGDVMQKTTTGGLFAVDDVEAEQVRYDQRETTITGPIFGPSMTSPKETTADREERILEASGLGWDAFRRFPRLSRGTRRPYSVWPSELSIEEELNGLRFRFALPKGSYATTFLREFMRNESVKEQPEPT
jgi:tRNA pseudouridine13 synthase